MRFPTGVYGTSLFLLTDLYELTMAQAYLRAGLGRHEAAFHHLVRSAPFGGSFAVACGLEPLLDVLSTLRPSEEDLAWLAGLRDEGGHPTFGDDFLAWLRGFRFDCDVDAIPEGTVVFPGSPLVRVRGPLPQAQLVETLVCNLLDFATLVATKSARVRGAARGKPIVEFGLRRAPGIDGGISATRAAFVGGCRATSHVLAGRMFGIPVRGTHAHSSVMAFRDEGEAFEAFARAMPRGLVFLVDTYETIPGVRRAIEAARGMRARGAEPDGIRLDSGNLEDLSRRARRMLDDAGFPAMRILASGDLDEDAIDALESAGAPIDAYGVGTRLVTGHPDAALSGVYKLGAVRAPDGAWERRVKASDHPAKSTTPGILQVRRFTREGRIVADVIYDLLDGRDGTRRIPIPEGAQAEDLLVPVLRGGRRVRPEAALDAIRERAIAQCEALHPGLRRRREPDPPPIGLEAGLHARRSRMLREVRGPVHPVPVHAPPAATQEPTEMPP